MQSQNIVYLVKPDEQNEELRYSLRSVAKNLPECQITIIGYKPSWVDKVKYVPVTQGGDKYVNTSANLSQAMSLFDDFYLFNDDFFINQMMIDIPYYHRGPMAKVMTNFRRRYQRGTTYTSKMEAVYQELKTLIKREPLFFDLHLPMMFESKKLKKTLATLSNKNGFTRTLYGNMYVENSVEKSDCKIYDLDEHDFTNYDFISSDDKSFACGRVGKYLRERFAEPCCYEI